MNEWDEIAEAMLDHAPRFTEPNDLYDWVKSQMAGESFTLTMNVFEALYDLQNPPAKKLKVQENKFSSRHFIC